MKELNDAIESLKNVRNSIQGAVSNLNGTRFDPQIDLIVMDIRLLQAELELHELKRTRKCRCGECENCREVDNEIDRIVSNYNSIIERR